MNKRIYALAVTLTLSAVACSKGGGKSSVKDEDSNTYYLSETLDNIAKDSFKDMNEHSLKLNARSWLGSYKTKSVVAVQEKGKNYLAIYDIEYVEAKAVRQGSFENVYASGYNKITKVVLVDLPSQSVEKNADLAATPTIECNGEKISAQILEDNSIYIYRSHIGAKTDEEKGFDYWGTSGTNFLKKSKDHPFISEFKLARSENAVKVDCRSEQSETNEDEQIADIVVPDLLAPTEMSLEIQRQLVGKTVDFRGMNNDSVEKPDLRVYATFHNDNEVTVTQFIYKDKKISMLSKIKTTYQLVNAPSGENVTVNVETKEIISDEVSDLGCKNNELIKTDYLLSLKDGKIRKEATEEELRFLDEKTVKELNGMVEKAIKNEVCSGE